MYSGLRPASPTQTELERAQKCRLQIRSVRAVSWVCVPWDRGIATDDNASALRLFHGWNTYFVEGRKVIEPVRRDPPIKQPN